MTTILDDVLPVVRLTKGAGSPGQAACWMSALSVVTAQKWTERLDCVDPVLNAMCIRINDALSNARRSEIILPRLFDPLGTAGDPEATERRRWHLVTAAITLWTPMALDRAAWWRQSLSGWADRLRVFGPVTAATSDAARALCCQARAAANAAAANAAAAAYAAAAAAFTSAANAAAAAIADNDQFIIEHVLPVLDELIVMGPHARREDVPIRCTPREFACAVGAR